MILECIGLLPHPVATGCGGAARSKGLVSLDRAGTAGETGVNRLTHELAHRPFLMTNKSFASANKLDFSVDAIVQEMQAHMRTLATPAVPGESVKAAISRAARRAGLEFGQARRLWYGLWPEVPGYIVEGIRERVAQKRTESESEIQGEISSLKSMLEKIMERLGGDQEPAS